MTSLTDSGGTIDRNLTLHDTYLSAMATYIDCIRNGVTTIFDHHASFGSIRGSLFEIEKAAKETGVRSCLCYEISDRDGMDKARESVMENAEFIRHALQDDSGMIAGMMGMHAQFTISDETMELAAANKPDEVGYHIHVAEGIEDLHHCLKHYGKRIVDRLMDHGILGEKSLLGHCIYINSHEMDLIKENGYYGGSQSGVQYGQCVRMPADDGAGAPGNPHRSRHGRIYA